MKRQELERVQQTWAAEMRRSNEGASQTLAPSKRTERRLPPYHLACIPKRRVRGSNVVDGCWYVDVP
jgi:hypothetical protein